MPSPLINSPPRVSDLTSMLLSDSLPIETSIDKSSPIELKGETETTLKTPESRKRTSTSLESQTSTSGSSSTSNDNPSPKRLFSNLPTSYTPSAPKNTFGKLFNMSY